MLHDLKLLLWLRLRRERGRIGFWATAGGADIDSTSGIERMYVFYLVVILAGALILAIGAAADSATKFGAGLTSPLRTAFTATITLIPSSLIAGLGKRALKSAPVRFTFPDIAYVAGSAFDKRAIALSGCLWEVVPAALAAVLVGYLVGKVGVGMGASTGAPGETAILAALTTAAIFLLAWVAGLFRVRFGHRPWHRWSWLAAPIVGSVIAVFPSSIRWPGIALRIAVEGRASAGDIFALLLVTLMALWLMIALAAKMDMVTVIEESAIYAELSALGPMRMMNSAAYHNIARRKRLAARGPKWHLPGGSGARALLARALVSHRRQPSVIAYPILWGLVLIPYIVFQVVRHPGFSNAVPVIMLFAMGPSADLLHVFREDIERPSLRELLPFKNLRLLLIDSAPVLAVIALASTIAVGTLNLSAGGRLLGWILCVLLGLIVVFCRGLEHLKLPRMRKPINYRISAAVSISIVLLAGSSGSLLLAALAALGVMMALGMGIRGAREF